MRRRRSPHTRVLEPLPQDALAVRLSTLQIIAATALAQGITITLRVPREGLSMFTFLPGWPGFYGLALTVGGAALLTGAWMRKPSLTRAGGWIAMLWYLFFGIGFVVQWALWREGVFNGSEPVVYPAWVNIGIATVLWAQDDIIKRTRVTERLLR